MVQWELFRTLFLQRIIDLQCYQLPLLRSLMMEITLGPDMRNCVHIGPVTSLSDNSDLELEDNNSH